MSLTQALGSGTVTLVTSAATLVTSTVTVVTSTVTVVTCTDTFVTCTVCHGILTFLSSWLFSRGSDSRFLFSISSYTASYSNTLGSSCRAFSITSRACVHLFKMAVHHSISVHALWMAAHNSTWAVVVCEMAKQINTAVAVALDPTLTTLYFNKDCVRCAKR